MVVTLQSQCGGRSFALQSSKLQQNCGRLREEKRMIERVEEKIGHSCSLSFPHCPPPISTPNQLQALQPTLSCPTFSTIPPPQHTHMHIIWCLLRPRPHVSCVYLLGERGKGGGGKRNSTFHRTHAGQKRRRKDNIRCLSVQRGLQCWEVVALHVDGLTIFYAKLVQVELRTAPLNHIQKNLHSCWNAHLRHVLWILSSTHIDQS